MCVLFNVNSFLNSRVCDSLDYLNTEENRRFEKKIKFQERKILNVKAPNERTLIKNKTS